MPRTLPIANHTDGKFRIGNSLLRSLESAARQTACSIESPFAIQAYKASINYM